MERRLIVNTENGMSNSSDDGPSLHKVFDTVVVAFRWQWVVNPSFAEVGCEPILCRGDHTQ